MHSTRSAKKGSGKLVMFCQGTGMGKQGIPLTPGLVLQPGSRGENDHALRAFSFEREEEVEKQGRKRSFQQSQDLEDRLGSSGVSLLIKAFPP